MARGGATGEDDRRRATGLLDQCLQRAGHRRGPRAISHRLRARRGHAGWPIPRVLQPARAPDRGKGRTPDEIEKEILFKGPLWDERIHFALNCASRSCPKLREEPYEASRLDTQLDFQTRTFLNGPQGHRIDPAGRVLYVSRILRWYREDFERAAGSPREYLIRNLTGDAAAAASDPAWKIDYLDYDWTLNDVM